jgi:hypothetical protein
MNRYRDDIQQTIAQLGDHPARVQMIARNLAECRELTDHDLDPETELALVCWLEEADDVLGRPYLRRPHEKPLR